MTASNLVASAAIATLGAGGALAQDLPPIEREFGPNTILLYGQVNQGVLSYDDGVETETYGPVDNDNSSSRIGLEFTSEAVEGLTFGINVELEVQPYASNVVNLGNRGDVEDELQDDDLRKLEAVIASDRFGTLSLGQGDMASNESAEVDLSGTTVVASSDVEDTAGGQLLRTEGGELSETVIGDDFDNLDGLGRLTRVRYDAPALLDDRLTLSASYGQDAQAGDELDQYDVAAAYEAEAGDLTVGAGVAYGFAGDDETVLSGSASVLHGPTGFSATVAGGRQDDGDVQGGYGYLKLGYEADLTDAGSTALSVDYYDSADLASDGSSARSYGLALVQRVDRVNTEVYAAVRSHAFDDEDDDYERSVAVLVGARFRF